MNRRKLPIRWTAALVAGLWGSAALAGACGGHETGGDAMTGSGPFPPGPSCPGGNSLSTNSCSDCAAAKCSAEEACVPTACSAFAHCFCECPANDVHCYDGCIAGGMPPDCMACEVTLEQCEVTNCSDACQPSSFDGGVITLDASLFVVDASASSCAAFAACCASIGNASLKAACESALPLTPAGCQIALSFYESAGFCE